MGGTVPIGYKREDKKLIIDEEQAEKVREIFEQYLEFESVPKLKAHLEKENIKTRADKPFAKGQLYHMLSNRTYIGKIIHKQSIYKGEHEAIIDEEVFNKAQKIMLENRVDKDCNTKSGSNSLLASKIFDDKNNRMSPSHSTTRGIRYRYYISQALFGFRETMAGSVSKIPAGEIEKFVIENIREYLRNKKEMQKFIKNLDVADQRSIFERLKKLDYNNPRLIRGMLDKVTISKEWIEISLCKNQIQNMLENFAYCDEIPAEIKSESHNPLVINKSIKISTTKQLGKNILIIPSDKEQAPMPNDSLIKAIVRCHYWHKMLETGKAK
ncbi:MAG: recombinase family protein, partial [Heliobacteriaceae bacterium]|nr:recombinase family protein [Heliobacteriaceae bacterium]